MDLYQELMQDEEFVEELLTKESVEDVKALFEERDAHLTDDEADGVFNFVEQVRDGDITAEEIRKLASGEYEQEWKDLAKGALLLGAAVGMAFIAGGVALGVKLLRRIED